VKVLLITKGGTEEVDTQNTEAVFIYEGATFNNALIEQAIARSVRYKSHYNLPKNQQKVFVYRLLIVKESDVFLINTINKNIIKNFSVINKRFMENSKKNPFET
jgi:hypothetical protein